MTDKKTVTGIVAIFLIVAALAGSFSFLSYENYYMNKQPYYQVTISEKGLPDNSSWSVNPNGVPWFLQWDLSENIYPSNGTSVILRLQNGTYQIFPYSSNLSYAANSVFVSVNGHDTAVNVTFHEISVSEAINNSYSQGLDVGIGIAVILLFFSWLGFIFYVEGRRAEEDNE